MEDIPKDILGLLNSGQIETVNLTEWLAVDHLKLIQAVFPQLGMAQDEINTIAQDIKSQKKPTAMNTTKLVGSTLYRLYSNTEKLEKILNKLSTHTSDSIRCYAP